MIKNAPIEFNEQGTPVSTQFDDVYFSNENGLLESDYVFYQQNDISQRLLNHDNARFVIAETGFGTGLNFLNTWYQFNLQHDKSVQQLHFVSFEKYPISKTQLIEILKQWPTLTCYAEQLTSLYPTSLKGCHRLEFQQGHIILDLWFGDVQDGINNMPYLSQGWIDAWYLDGFAPSKNPEMWQQSLFNEMAHLGRAGCTLATFTAAGDVRRGLIEAGFTVSKRKGFGKKREMLVGALTSPTAKSNATPYFMRPGHTPKKVAIIGGGIAAANIALALAKKGLEFDVFCQAEALASEASGNQQGALYPHIQVDVSNSSEFFAHAFYYARRTYDQLLQSGHHFDHQWCGVLLQAVKPAKLAFQENLLTKQHWPTSLIYGVDEKESEIISGVRTPYRGLFIPDGGWINPPSLIQALFDAAYKCVPFSLHLNCEVQQLHNHNNQWQLQTSLGDFTNYSHVVIACGDQSHQFKQSAELPLVPVRGQVSQINATHHSKTLKTVLCHKGYFTPHYRDQHCMGATFDKGESNTEVRESDNQLNFSQFNDFYAQCDFASELSTIDSAKAAIRCTVIDHLPLAGQVTDSEQFALSFAPIKKGQYHSFLPYHSSQPGLYSLTALGARGLCSAPLLAEMIACEMLGYPLPVSKRVADALHPARFNFRQLKKGH
ncbi:tRNA 5-methylaminomethyl-2-thiouridine biosynthesis bifunctional protein [Pseudoalteromonas ulvae UL12]|uniref:tRNA 5-methylaminomethyl-2-thiouridine biosynthesis bifunctional protein MnmC n=1 Tax=Pseudoalteromonas ulvae TaxID=107327 RepID=A0A244CS60_PSEDV|nr:bifunctional tRNA (5-methylaminomethyl-2-thiouridine)(34)-methyltransferase MnmD/FAD-dependent 5-carboxymethylaminomethyl-2-thiouridine(34) oxidoreductase MnmC [Pseudoalteromonas ulvae]MBE0363581.1 tRNA 5-methylaminomethyl-2-thiouridine biosynthesis bifunctional protein [Pseudoalteromonas ulvae UL12]OUL58445.1 bifunctional tRNA (5-methylaminomethyl-2-thiouridine)(34)-methyltransferase MnmD/FAD-dependent 5-carboxymethylaminomethyl-2-thiouridine(34) oxidoreductase MnmC [Pseudoalteromonas ulvae]